MYLQAVKRPFSSIRRLIWGIILLSIPILNLLFFGYLYECARSAYAGKTVLPKWENYRILFLNGLKMLIINVIYTIPVYLLLTLASTFYLTIDDLLGFPIFLLCFFIIYLLPLALINFMIHGKFVFAFKGYFKKTVSWLYLKTILKLLILIIPYMLFNAVLVLLLFSLLASFDWLSYVLSIFLISFAAAAYQITAFTVLANVYRKL